MGRNVQQINRFKGLIGKNNPRLYDGDYLITASDVDLNDDNFLIKPYEDNYDMTADDSAYGINFDYGIFLTKPDGKKALVGSNATAGYLGVIDDFYGGSPTYSHFSSVTDGVTDAIVKDSKAYIAKGQTEEPIIVYADHPRQLDEYINEVSVNGISDFEIDARNATATTTQRVKVTGTASSVGISSIANSSGNTKLNATVTSLGLSAGDTIAVVLTIQITERGNEFEGDRTETLTYNGLYEVLATDGTSYVTVNIPWQDGTFSSGTIRKNSGTFSYQYSTDGGSTYSTATTITPYEWQDLANGVKIKFKNATALSNNDTWDIVIDSSGTSYTPSADTAKPEANSVEFESAIVDEADSNGDFDSQKFYYIAYSLTYDGINESPLKIIGTFNPLQTSKSLTVKILVDISTISDRVTNINLWCASATKTSYWEKSKYRLIESFDLSHGHFEYYSSTKRRLIAKTNSLGNESYEAFTGMPDTYEEVMPKFELCTLLNDSMFVGKASIEDLTNSEYCIFRSIPGAFLNYRWTEDILRMPEIPTAMIGYEGKLYVFSQKNLYRVNYDLFIEDIIPNAGVSSPRLLCLTEAGLFWKSGNTTIYKLLGGQISKVWESDMSTYTTEMLVYKAKTNELFSIYGTNAIVYEVYKQTATKASVGTLDIQSAFPGELGEAYVVHSGKIHKLLEQGTSKTYTVITNDLYCGLLEVSKKFYYLNLDKDTSSVTVQYSVDEGTTWTTITGSNGEYEIKNSSGSWVSAQKIRFKITGQAEIKGFTLVYRPIRSIKGGRTIVS